MTSPLKPSIEIIGVETALYPSFVNAIRGENRPVGGATLAEGIAVKTVGQKPLPIVRDLVSDIILVDEPAIERAVAAYATLQRTMAEELQSVLPMLRRLPRRIDRITGAMEQGRLSLSMRLFADERDRSFVTGLLHQVMLTVLGATAGVMAVLLLGSSGGPEVTQDIGLYQVFGYNLLIISVLLGLRVVVTVFRPRA